MQDPLLSPAQNGILPASLLTIDGPLYLQCKETSS